MTVLRNGGIEEKLWGLMRCVAFSLHTNSTNSELRRLSKVRKVALQFLQDKFIPRYIDPPQRVESYFNHSRTFALYITLRN